MLRTFKLKAEDTEQNVEITVKMTLKEHLTMNEAYKEEESLKDDIFQYALLPRYYVSNIKVVD